MLPERFVRSFPNNYLASDLALRFGKRSDIMLAVFFWSVGILLNNVSQAEWVKSNALNGPKLINCLH